MAEAALPMSLCPYTFEVDVIGPDGVVGVQFVTHGSTDLGWVSSEAGPVSEEAAAAPSYGRRMRIKPASTGARDGGGS